MVPEVLKYFVLQDFFKILFSYKISHNDYRES